MSSLLWIAFIFWLTPDGVAHSSMSSHIYHTEAACLEATKMGVEARPEMFVWGDCYKLPGDTV